MPRKKQPSFIGAGSGSNLSRDGCTAAQRQRILLSPLLLEEEECSRSQLWGSRLAYKPSSFSSPTPHSSHECFEWKSEEEAEPEETFWFGSGSSSSRRHRRSRRQRRTRTANRQPLPPPESSHLCSEELGRYFKRGGGGAEPPLACRAN